jgi:protein-S-isoprenylcysteine O-methyltransferase Ste14
MTGIIDSSRKIRINFRNKEKIMNEKVNRPQLVLNPLILLVLTIAVTALLQWLFPMQVIPLALARILGILLFLGGIAFGFPALAGMIRARTSPNPNHTPTVLVSDGIYRITRNPMYLGMLISYAGLFIFARSLWWLLFLPLLAWLMTAWVIIPEEKFLAQKFGEEYVQFKTRVHRWI